MGRVTVEDILKKVSSHFDLVLVASERARQISDGKKSHINKKSKKTHVMALRELEEETISIDDLKQSLQARINNISQQENEDDHDIIQELQSSEFIQGELEEINLEQESSPEDNNDIVSDIEINLTENIDKN